MSGYYTGWTLCLLASWLTGWLIYWLAVWVSDRLAGSMTDDLEGWTACVLACWLVARLISYFYCLLSCTDWLTGWMTDWLFGCLTGCLPLHLQTQRGTRTSARGRQVVHGSAPNFIIPSQIIIKSHKSVLRAFFVHSRDPIKCVHYIITLSTVSDKLKARFWSSTSKP